MKKITLVLLSIILILCSVQISAQTTWNSTDYPDPPSQMANPSASNPTYTSTILPPFFKLKHVGTRTFSTTEIKGDIMRVLHRGNKTVVLSHEWIREIPAVTQKWPLTGTQISHIYPASAYYEPHLYLITHTYANGVASNTITEMSLSGIKDQESSNKNSLTNYGNYCNLSDIALSADGYIIGINNIRMYHRLHHPAWTGQLNGEDIHTGTGWDKSPDNATQYKPNNLYIYRWKINDWEASNFAQQGFNTWYTCKQLAGKSGPWNWWCANFYRSDVGYTLSVSGNAGNTDGNECTITWTAARPPYPDVAEDENDNSNGTVIRFVHLKCNYTTAWTQSEARVSKKGEGIENEFHTEKIGSFYELTNSPYNTKCWVIDGPGTTPWTFEETSTYYKPTNTSDNAQPAQWKDGTQLSSTVNGDYPVQNNFFRYGKRNLMLSPYETNGHITGVQLLDIGTSFKNVATVSLLGIEAKNYISTTGNTDHVYTTALAQVEGNDLTIYFWVNHTLYTYTTKNHSQGRGVFAYGLSSTFDSHNNDYQFKFKVNETPYSAVLKLYEELANEGGGQPRPSSQSMSWSKQDNSTKVQQKHQQSIALATKVQP